MSSVVEKAAPPTEIARLELNGKELELPVVVGAEQERGIDISKLLATTGCVTLDEGYANTGATVSKITFLDGDRGILRYRGYGIEDLAGNCDFLEVAHLLIYGELPTEAQLATFRGTILRHTMLHEEMRKFYGGFPRDAHPMAILSAAVSALSTFYQDSLDPNDPRQVEVSIHRLLAKLPTIAAYSHKKSIGQPFVYPQNDLTYCANFLQMMFAVPCEPYEVDPDAVAAIYLLLIVHADHEQNCSTSTVRMVGSSNANLFASVSAGICALWGPLHGGANEAVVLMLDRILAEGGDVKKFVDMAKDKRSNFRLMGFGHRVYKNFDPPAARSSRRPATSCSPKWRSAIRSSTSPRNWSKSRCTIRISLSASFIPTSISTPASSTGHSVFPLACSPFCLPLAAFPAGSPIGLRCTKTPKNASAVPGRSTPGPPIARWFR